MSQWRGLQSAVRRRARWIRWRLSGDRPTTAEAAFAWLFGPGTIDGVPATLGDPCASREATRAAVAVAYEYGMEAHGGSWQARLASLEKAPSAARPARDWAAELAQQAIDGYRRGDHRAADRILARLARRQTRQGAFPLYWGWLGNSRQQSGMAAVYYLAAARLQVEAAFEAPSCDLPMEIDPADGRLQSVLQWAASLGCGAALLDIGCGPGRFLRHLADAYPGIRLVGVDPSASMLTRLPAGVEARQGHLLRIPAAAGEFDAALAVESLEHSLVPSRGVEELCRVVRPGGRVLIIDKDRAEQALSEHEPWERWFRPQELASWLAPFCDDVQVEPIAHLEGRPGRHLFLAAAGRRKRGGQTVQCTG